MAPPEALTGYVWPLPAGRLTLPFGPSSPWGSHVVNGQRFHDGIDLATFCGDRIRAAHDGVVIAAGRRFDSKIGWVGDLGRYTRRLTTKSLWQSLPITVVVDDGNGYRSIYTHFSRIVVRTGQTIQAGQFLGYEGQTGHASGCHLHYGIFNPAETLLMALRPDVVARMKLPRYARMRIDPLNVLPHRRGRGDPAPRTYRTTLETALAATAGISPFPTPGAPASPALRHPSPRPRFR